MYRQRFFQDVVPRLLDLYRHSDAGNNKAACLTAIANQLAFIPRGVLLSHTATLVPLLIQCLTSEQPEQLVASSIDALLDLMADNTSAVVEYIDSLVPRLLKLAQDGRTMVTQQLSLLLLHILDILVNYPSTYFTARPPSSSRWLIGVEEGSTNRSSPAPISGTNYNFKENPLMNDHAWFLRLSFLF